MAEQHEAYEDIITGYRDFPPPLSGLELDHSLLISLFCKKLCQIKKSNQIITEYGYTLQLGIQVWSYSFIFHVFSKAYVWDTK